CHAAAVALVERAGIAVVGACRARVLHRVRRALRARAGTDLRLVTLVGRTAARRPSYLEMAGPRVAAGPERGLALLPRIEDAVAAGGHACMRRWRQRRGESKDHDRHQEETSPSRR